MSIVDGKHVDAHDFIEPLLEMKSCPFCSYKGPNSPFMVKGKDYDCNIRDEEEQCHKAYVWFHITCLKCKSKSGEFSSPKQAIEAWNRRVDYEQKP